MVSIVNRVQDSPFFLVFLFHVCLNLKWFAHHARNRVLLAASKTGPRGQRSVAQLRFVAVKPVQ